MVGPTTKDLEPLEVLVDPDSMNGGTNGFPVPAKT
jgi:hypothetical protein